jgi:hypothetical protein
MDATRGSAPSFVQSTANIGTRQVNNQMIWNMALTSLDMIHARAPLDDSFGSTVPRVFRFAELGGSYPVSTLPMDRLNAVQTRQLLTAVQLIEAS